MGPTQPSIVTTQGIDPLSTKDANANQATSKTDEKNAVKSREPRTRVPPSVREKERQAHEAKLTSTTVTTTTVTSDLSHTSPSVEKRGTGADDAAWVRQKILRLENGVVEKNMGKIEKILRALKKENLRFDQKPIADFLPHMREYLAGVMHRIVQSGAPSAQVTRILIDMINLGCDPTVRTGSDNTLLIKAAAYGVTELVDVILSSCPDIDKHALNIDGKNAAMLAQEHGHTDALNLLIQEGVKLQPRNPALHFYKANLQRFNGEDAGVAYAHLSSLLDGTHLINLPDETGKTLIFHAVLNQDVQMVHFLCKQNGFPDLTRVDQSGKTALDYLDKLSDADIVAAMAPVLEKLLSDTTDEV